MLLDNKGHGKVGDALRDGLSQGARLAVLSREFSVYAFALLQRELSQVSDLRLLLPADSTLPDEATHGLRVEGLVGGAVDRRMRNTLNLSRCARDCAQWLKAKGDVRVARLPVAQNLFHVQEADGEAMAIHGSSPFTASGLGFSPASGYEMNTCFRSSEEAQSLLQWFDSIWGDSAASADAKDALLAQLAEICEAKSPELIYFLTLFNLFRDLLGELDEDRIIKTRTGIKDTLVWSKLYRFQRDGVLGAIDKIEKHNGCIIADSVGLGKTFEALAIIKYYELRNDRVLVLCPKRLSENWTLYTINDRRNLFAADRFNYDVLNHTDLIRTRGKSGELNLETINWGNYDLVVIDEMSIEDIEVEDEDFAPYLVGSKVKVLIQNVDQVRWKQELEEDAKALASRRDLLARCHSLEVEITEQRALLGKETQFNRQVDLNARIKQLEKELLTQAASL